MFAAAIPPAAVAVRFGSEAKRPTRRAWQAEVLRFRTSSNAPIRLEGVGDCTLSAAKLNAPSPRSAPLRAAFASQRFASHAKRRPFRGPFRFLGRSGKKEAENNRPFRRGELCAFLSTSSMPTGNVNPATDRGTRWRGSEPRLGRQGGASRAGIPPNNVHRGPAFRFKSVSCRFHRFNYVSRTYHPGEPARAIVALLASENVTAQQLAAVWD